ncbi:MAG: hypothetical protein WB992_16835 [Bryobacteraceae bacterium]
MRSVYYCTMNADWKLLKSAFLSRLESIAFGNGNRHAGRGREH